MGSVPDKIVQDKVFSYYRYIIKVKVVSTVVGNLPYLSYTSNSSASASSSKHDPMAVT